MHHGLCCGCCNEGFFVSHAVVSLIVCCFHLLLAADACRYSAGSDAHVLWGVGIREREQVTALMARLSTAGLPTLDISGIEAAQARARPRRHLHGVHENAAGSVAWSGAHMRKDF